MAVAGRTTHSLPYVLPLSLLRSAVGPPQCQSTFLCSLRQQHARSTHVEGALAVVQGEEAATSCGGASAPNSFVQRNWTTRRLQARARQAQQQPNCRNQIAMRMQAKLR